ncbi:Uncharacterised protein (plasmid) [Tsukamurella tyrosinosolvens]|uniref:Uncharacterized protein n=1 Tax=Tsukamurella tyrosinosolvens TaxID=57704 RepID=A0A1H4UL72_TSUTY|nr:hypothetical protein [Tsukamurella tyrosinosolvens]KXO99062.1 hypothetical protein AXK58_24215 [Tsukamurella tyrosinosolvens]SEC69652.1 hypothetical protein SAMN04489793_2946 [Tsukamurella tyrosinosolvens]VEH94339.1 Uncharacterised protein [Tsukamurella tyrosinosolvens]
MSDDTEVLSTDARLRGHVFYVDGDWFFDVDWVRPDGTRDTDINSYEYGLIDPGPDPRLSGMRIVERIISEFDEKYRDLPYGSPRP